MRIKILSLLASMLLVAACGSTPAPTPAPGPAPAPAPQTSSVTPGTVEDFQVNVGDRVFFETNRSDLSPQARAVLERQAEWLASYPNVSVTVEGHADERGTRQFNLALGERRAAAVRDYLVALGVPSNRLNTISYGKERPAVLGSNPQAWAQNRRGVTVIN